MLTDPAIATAAVVGAGLMGRRIAGVIAAGVPTVRLYDVRTEILADAAEVARQTAAELGAAVRVSVAGDLSQAVRGTDLVVEAIAENLAVKRALFARMSELAPGAILATNTSVLPIRDVAAEAAHPGRCLGTHWWNPPDLMPLVEVTPSAHTDPEVTDRVERLLVRLGKTPVRVRRDVPGFIGNRLQHALWREAFALVADGVCDPETVDIVVRNTFGLRMAGLGPIENADYIGLDLTLAIHDAVLPSLNRDPAPNPLLRALVARGDLGAKTGRGFLTWPPTRPQETATRLAAHVAALLTSPSLARSSASP